MDLDQPTEVEVVINRNRVVLGDLGRFYDCGLEFNFKVTGQIIKDILDQNPRLAADALVHGCGDTVVGDEFYVALQIYLQNNGRLR